MKRNIYQLLFIVITASLMLTACTSPSPVPTTDIQIQDTQSIQLSATTAPPTNTSAPIATQPPTNTPLPTEASTPTQPPIPTDTPTPVVTPMNTPTNVSMNPTAHVDENTNCRGGPSSDYPLIVVLLSGGDVKIVSKTTLEDYLLVENPENPVQACWLWTKYVSINGDLSSLPVATPPPPLLNFTLAYTKIETCGSFSLAFKVVNTGSKTLQSYTIVAKDLSANSQQTTSSTVFDLRNGCAVEEKIGYVDPGKAGYVYANDFTYNPSGHSIEATITVCSHDDQTGTCGTRVIKFTP